MVVPWQNGAQNLGPREGETSQERPTRRELRLGSGSPLYPTFHICICVSEAILTLSAGLTPASQNSPPTVQTPRRGRESPSPCPTSLSSPPGLHTLRPTASQAFQAPLLHAARPSKKVSLLHPAAPGLGSSCCGSLFPSTPGCCWTHWS